MFTIRNKENKKMINTLIKVDNVGVSFKIGYYSTLTTRVFVKEPTFKILNEYLDFKGDSFKNKLLAHYVSIYDIYENIWQIDRLINGISKEASNIIDMFDFNDLNNWITNYVPNLIPSDLTDKYDTAITRNGLGSREQTYIRKDYIELIGLTLIFKLFMPIWGEFIYRFGSEVGTKFKEYIAFNILENTNIVESDAYKKLVVYINKIVEKELINGPNIKLTMEGISSDIVSEWLLSNVAVRRLIVANIEPMDNNTNLITNIHGFAKSKINGPTTISSSIKDKTGGDSSASDEDRISILESYKLSENLPSGTIVEYNWFVKDTERLIQNVEPEIDRDFLYSCIETSRILNTKRISVPQLALISWTLSPSNSITNARSNFYIDPRYTLYLDKQNITKLAGITQAILWHRGHQFLSLLASSYEINIGDSQVINTSSGKSRIPKDLKEAISKIYPYARPINGKTEQSANVVIEVIDNIVNMLNSKIWRLTADKELVLKATDVYSKELIIPFNIKTLLSELIISINKN